MTSWQNYEGVFAIRVLSVTANAVAGRMADAWLFEEGMMWGLRFISSYLTYGLLFYCLSLHSQTTGRSSTRVAAHLPGVALGSHSPSSSCCMIAFQLRGSVPFPAWGDTLTQPKVPEAKVRGS